MYSLWVRAPVQFQKRIRDPCSMPHELGFKRPDRLLDQVVWQLAVIAEEVGMSAALRGCLVRLRSHRGQYNTGSREDEIGGSDIETVTGDW